MKYLTICDDVKVRIIPVSGRDDVELSSIAYNEVRKLGADILGYSNLVIEKDERGKPFFQGNIDCDLSISHTDGMVAVAVGKKCKIGVDVEKIHKISNVIVNKYYSPLEKKAISQNKENVELIETKIWTRKEAYSKCLGTGLNKKILAWDSYSNRDIIMETKIYNNYVVTLCRMDEFIPIEKN